MQHNYRKVVLLFFVFLIVLGGFYYFYKIKQGPKGTPEASENTQDTSLVSTKIDAFGMDDTFSVTDGVVQIHQGNQDVPIPGADPLTFKILGDGYAKDSAHVWFYHLGVYTLQGIKDPASFSVLAEYIGKDTYNVYRLGTNFTESGTESVAIVPGANPLTFKVISNIFAKDDQHVWGWRGLDLTLFIEGAEANHFIILNNSFEKTNTTVYRGINIMNGADPATFIALDTHNAKDANHAFDFLGVIFTKIADVKTLVSLGDGKWFKDSAHVYVGDGEIVDQADPATFVELGNYYGKDYAHVFYGEVPSFVMTDTPPPKGKIIAGADVNSFVVLGYSYAKDSLHIYNAGVILKDADVATFGQIGTSFYFKDNSHVWYAGDGGPGLVLIPGADAATFTVTDNSSQAQDAHHTYGIDGRGNFWQKPKSNLN